jgi:hypothetical protein
MTLISSVHSPSDRRAGQADLHRATARRLPGDVPDRGEHQVRHLLVRENDIGWWRVFEPDDSEPVFRSDRLRAEDRAREMLRAEGGGVVRVFDHAGEQVSEYVVQPRTQPRRVGTPETRRPRRRWGW